MKQIICTTILVLAFCVANFGQESKTVAEPVKDSKPFIMSGSQLENLEVAASMDRFGKIDNSKKKARLDLLTSLISAENKTIEFVIQVRGKTKEDVGQNLEVLYTYLVEKKKIKPTRISFAIAPAGEEAMEFWLIPNKNVSIPTCSDCSIIQAEDQEKLKEYFQIKEAKK